MLVEMIEILKIFFAALLELVLEFSFVLAVCVVAEKRIKKDLIFVKNPIKIARITNKFNVQ